jgi:hypothetical protein
MKNKQIGQKTTVNKRPNFVAKMSQLWFTFALPDAPFRVQFPANQPAT